ncbi:Ig-like domain repeat protein [Cryobacterium sp. AP23]
MATEVHTVWVSIVNATATTADNLATGLDGDANVRGLVAKMNAFWAEESGGRISVVFGGYEKRDLNGSCGLSDIFSRASQKAFSGKFDQYHWMGTKEHLLILPRDGCFVGGVGGLGSLGGGGGVMLGIQGVSGVGALPVVLHEFGHNLGFSHANSAICPSSASTDAAAGSYLNGTCPVERYGDTLDIMGSARDDATPHLSSPQRISAGYLSDVKTLTAGSATTTIMPLDSRGTTGTRALRVVDPLTQETYVVEFRTSAGADATSAEFAWPQQHLGPFKGSFYSYSSDMSPITGGVRVLRELPYAQGTETAVLATGLIPGSLDKRLRDTHLDAGESFVSVNGGFTLRVTSLNAKTGAVVTVTFGTTPAAPIATAVTLDQVAGADWWTQVSGSTKTLQVRATATAGNGKVPSGKMVFLAGTRSLATVATNASGVALYTLPSTLTAGTYAVAAQFVPTATTLAPSRSAESTLTVTPGPAASTTGLTVSRSSQVYGSATRIAATAAVAKVGGVYPAGNVEFLSGGTVLGSARLGAGGTAVYTLSSTLGVAARSITARFVPATAAVRASTSPAVAVTVTKATAKAVVSLLAASVKTTKSAVVKVAVTVPGVARPTGTLAVYANGKLVKSYPLAAAAAGKASLTLPVLSTAGVKTITVRYSGSANILAATSSGARLTVVK